MADNVQITQGSGTTIAADEVTRNAVSEKQQIVKIGLGAEGAHDVLVDSGEQTEANSVPVVAAASEAVYQKGQIAAASMTTSYQVILTPSSAAKAIEINNRTEKNVIVSFDGGATDHRLIEPFSAWGISLKIINKKESSAIQVKLESGTAATGAVDCFIVRD